MKQVFVVFFVLLILAGCGGPGSRTTSKTPSLSHGTDPWKLVCTDPNALTPALLWNGQIGMRIGRDGTGLDSSGKSLPFLFIDEYEKAGNEAIKAWHHPFAGELLLEDSGRSIKLSSRGATDYLQVLDMKTGALSSSWTQNDPHGKPIAVKIVHLMHPVDRIIGRKVFLNQAPEKLNILYKPLAVPAKANAISYLPGEPVPDTPIANRHISDSFTMPPLGFLTKSKKDYSFEQCFSFGLSPEYPYLIGKRREAIKLKHNFANPPKCPGFEELQAECTKIWAERWKTDIVIEGPVEDQQAIRSFLFYLRSGLHPESPMAISPLGLSKQTYNGHVFWDADTWIFPVMALIDPKAALAIPQYRLQMKKAAQQNFWNQWGKNLEIRKEVGIVQYPWESSVSGLEVSPSASRKQVHITGSVARMLDQASALGLADPKQVQNINTSAAKLYLAISTKASVTNSSSNKEHEVREIKRVMSADEYHIGDNDLYTNMLAQWLYDKYLLGKPMEPGMGTYPKLEYKLPRDKTSFLTYDNDPLKIYQQAAAVLSIYPLQNPEAEAQAEAMMNRFADKVEPEGPAMSHSFHALIWARLGKTDKAYETWRKCWQEYTQHPLLLFSEKRSKDVTYFTTGAAGCLQSVIFGILNLRLDDKKDPIAPWATPLREGKWLTVRPSLPKQWKSVTFKNFSVLGKRYTLTATPEHVQVTPGG